MVNFKEYFTVWIHDYLVEEYLPYENLGDYITNNFPFHGSNLEYVNVIKKIACNLVKAIEDIHSRGIAVGDLQPDNVLIDENKNVILIDFEQANRKKEKYNPGLKTTGFVDFDVHTYAEADWIAVYKTIRHAFLPRCGCRFPKNVSFPQPDKCRARTHFSYRPRFYKSARCMWL